MKEMCSIDAARHSRECAQLPPSRHSLTSNLFWQRSRGLMNRETSLKRILMSRAAIGPHCSLFHDHTSVATRRALEVRNSPLLLIADCFPLSKFQQAHMDDLRLSIGLRGSYSEALWPSLAD